MCIYHNYEAKPYTIDISLIAWYVSDWYKVWNLRSPGINFANITSSLSLPANVIVSPDAGEILFPMVWMPALSASLDRLLHMGILLGLCCKVCTHHFVCVGFSLTWFDLLAVWIIVAWVVSLYHSALSPCGRGSKGSIYPLLPGKHVSNCHGSHLPHTDTPVAHVSLWAFQSYWNQDIPPPLCSNFITVWRWAVINIGGTRSGIFWDIIAM